MNSRIEENQETGAKALIVYYDRRTDNFDQAIESGLAEHGLKNGEVNVIALPETIKNSAKEILTD